MKPALLLSIVMTVFFGFAVSPAHAEGSWLTTISDAAAKASETDKLVLAEFTGSDWCGWCIQMHETVTTKQKFLDEIQKDFVLCSVDYLQSSPMVNEEYVYEMLEAYRIESFPTYLLLDGEGTPLQKVETSYQDGVDGVLKKMRASAAAGKKRKAAIAVLSKVLLGDGSDEEKSKAGLELFDHIVEFDWFYKTQFNAMKSLDASNQVGLSATMKMYTLLMSGFPAPDAWEAQQESVNELLAIENLSDYGKQFAAMFQSIIYKAQGEQDKAIEESEKVKGMTALFSTPFDFKQFQAWIAEKPPIEDGDEDHEGHNHD